jgi:hypothetical protein
MWYNSNWNCYYTKISMAALTATGSIAPRNVACKKAGQIAVKRDTARKKQKGIV